MNDLPRHRLFRRLTPAQLAQLAGYNPLAMAVADDYDRRQVHNETLGTLLGTGLGAGLGGGLGYLAGGGHGALMGASALSVLGGVAGTGIGHAATRRLKPTEIARLLQARQPKMVEYLQGLQQPEAHVPLAAQPVLKTAFEKQSVNLANMAEKSLGVAEKGLGTAEHAAGTAARSWAGRAFRGAGQQLLGPMAQRPLLSAGTGALAYYHTGNKPGATFTERLAPNATKLTAGAMGAVAAGQATRAIPNLGGSGTWSFAERAGGMRLPMGIVAGRFAGQNMLPNHAPAQPGGAAQPPSEWELLPFELGGAAAFGRKALSADWLRGSKTMGWLPRVTAPLANAVRRPASGMIAGTAVGATADTAAASPLFGDRGQGYQTNFAGPAGWVGLGLGTASHLPGTGPVARVANRAGRALDSFSQGTATAMGTLGAPEFLQQAKNVGRNWDKTLPNMRRAGAVAGTATLGASLLPTLNHAQSYGPLGLWDGYRRSSADQQSPSVYTLLEQLKDPTLPPPARRAYMVQLGQAAADTGNAALQVQVRDPQFNPDTFGVAWHNATRAAGVPDAASMDQVRQNVQHSQPLPLPGLRQVVLAHAGNRPVADVIRAEQRVQELQQAHQGTLQSLDTLGQQLEAVGKLPPAQQAAELQRMGLDPSTPLDSYRQDLASARQQTVQNHKSQLLRATADQYIPNGSQLLSSIEDAIGNKARTEGYNGVNTAIGQLKDPMTGQPVGSIEGANAMLQKYAGMLKGGGLKDLAFNAISGMADSVLSMFDPSLTQLSGLQKGLLLFGVLSMLGGGLGMAMGGGNGMGMAGMLGLLAAGGALASHYLGGPAKPPAKPPGVSMAPTTDSQNLAHAAEQREAPAAA